MENETAFLIVMWNGKAQLRVTYHTETLLNVFKILTKLLTTVNYLVWDTGYWIMH